MNERNFTNRCKAAGLAAGLGVLAVSGRAGTGMESFSAEVKLRVGYRYLVELPEGYEKEATKRWPLLIFLHGAGERGEDLEMVKKHGPFRLMAEGRKFPAVVVAPQADLDTVWNPYGVKALTDELIRKYRVDVDRVYLTGLSMGGFGTWETAIANPGTYAAIAPICGGAGVGWVMVKRIKDVPCWIFHGEADEKVPLFFAERMHKAMVDAGGSPKLTVYPGVGHDSWTQTYANEEFWEWLFAQKRGAAAPQPSK